MRQIKIIGLVILLLFKGFVSYGDRCRDKGIAELQSGVKNVFPCSAFRYSYSLNDFRYYENPSHNISLLDYFQGCNLLKNHAENTSTKSSLSKTDNYQNSSSFYSILFLLLLLTLFCHYSFLRLVIRKKRYLIIILAGLLFTINSNAQTQSIYTVSGTYIWTCPVGVTSVTVECWGGGGKGGTLTSNGAAAGGGGGAYSRSVLTVVPGNIYTVNVGMGSEDTNPGGDSWFNTLATIRAKGGNSVSDDSNTSASGGAAGSGVGNVRYSGGNSARGSVTDSYGGGGGSSAGTAANGNYTNTWTINSIGGVITGGGNGGNGRDGSQGNGNDGSGPGGGGGGALRTSWGNRAGGFGADGQVNISWTTPAGYCSGYATAVYSQSGVVNASNSLNAYDDNVATLNDTNDQLVLDLTGGNYLNSGGTISIRWRRNPSTGSTPDDRVDVSSDGSSWITINTYTISSLSFIVETFTLPINARYIRFTETNTYDVDIDGVSYYAQCCTNPTITGTTPGSRCGTGTVVLGATASAGTINWYAASSGGSSLGTGTSFTTPSISSTTTYYVDATDNGCTTASRTAVTATVTATIGNNTIDYTNITHGVICATAAENTNAVLTAPTGTVFINVGFSSYGTPDGACPAFTIGGCNALTSQTVAEGYLLGNNTASIPATNPVFGDPCVGTFKRLYILATYTEPVCAGDAPGTITGTLPTGGSGYTYLWESSTTGPSSGFTTASGTSNLQNYTPGILSQTTWYRRTVTSGGCSSTSTPIIVKVIPSIAGNTIGSAQSICTGSTPAVLTGTIPTGGNDSYIYLWESSTTSSLSGFAPASGTNNGQNYAPGTLSQTTWYRRRVTSGGCINTSPAIQITVTVLPVATFSYAGTPYCQNGANPSPTFSGGGVAGTFSSSPSGLVFISTATGQVNLAASTPGSYTVTNTIAASDGCGVGTATSPITINPVIANNSVSSPQTICSGTTPNTLSGSLPTGGNGSYTYNWESSTTSAVAGFGNAGGTRNGQNYTPSSLTQTTWFRRTVTSGGCTNVSSAIQITVTSLPAAVTVSGGGTFCNSATLTASNGGDGTIYFQGTTSGGTSTATPSSSQLVSSPGTYYFRALSAAGCWGPEGSATVVFTSPTTTGANICQGGSGALTSSGCPAGGTYDSGPRNAGTGTDNNAVGTVAWGTPGNITVAGNPYATMSVPTSSTTHYLQGSNYGFAIPANATINGITVVINRQSSGSTSPLLRDSRVSLVKAVGGVQSTNKAITGTNWSNSGLETATYGGSSDLWGTTWTPAEINTSGFGVVLSAINGNTSYSRTATVDYIQITVSYTVNGLNWYTAPSGGTLIGSGSPFNPVGIAGSGLPDTNTPGTYTFYAECSSNPGCRTATPFVIYPATIATFNYDGNPYCSDAANPFPTFTGGGVAGTFSAAPAGLVFVSTATGQVNLAASTPGTYTVTNTIPASGGCGIVTATSPITINSRLSVSVSISPSANSICSGTSVTYTATPTNGGTTPAYQWKVNGINVGANSPTYTYTPVNGDVVTCVLTSNVACPAGNPATSNTVTMAVNTIPTVNATPSSQTTCSGTSISQINISNPNNVSGTTYTWTRTNTTNLTGIAANGSGSSISGTLVNTLNTAQSTTFTITATANGCSSTTTATVTVNPAPYVTNRTATICSGNTFPAIIPTNGGGNIVPAGTTYSWPAPVVTGGITGGSAQTGQSSISQTLVNPTSSPQTATYTVTPVSGTSGNCVGPTFTVTVTVNPAPFVNIAANYCLTGENAGDVLLTASGGGSYSWAASDGEVLSTEAELLVDIADIYTVTVTNAYSCTAAQSYNVALELVTDGNFESYNAASPDFITDYGYRADIAGVQNELVPEGLYGVGADANNYHTNFFGRDRMNPGTGKFMIVNGWGNTYEIWKQTVPVTPGVAYYFSAWAMSLNTVGNYAKLQFEVNGVKVGTVANLGAGPANNSQVSPSNWVRFYSQPTWVCPPGVTTAVIRIINNEPALNGNDFGLDDISFATLAPSPATIDPPTPNPVCDGGTLYLHANLTGGKPPFTYSWVGPNGFTSDIADPVIPNVSVANSGLYTLTITDGYGCGSITKTTDVTIYNEVSASINPSEGAVETCLGGTAPVITFTGSGGQEPYTFNYTINGVPQTPITTTSPSSSVTLPPLPMDVSASYNYTITSVSDVHGCTNSNPITSNLIITIHQPPTCSITGNGTTVCPGVADNIFSGPAGMSSYSWSISGTGGTITGATNSSTVTVSSTANCNSSFTLNLTIIDANGCTSSCSQLFSVIDDQPPVLTGTIPTGQNGIVAGIAGAPAGPTVAEIAAQYSDNCSTVTVTKSGTPTGNNCNWSVTYTYSVTDACGNVVSPSPSVTYTGGIIPAPTLTCPPNAVDLITDGGCNLVSSVIGRPTFGDECAISSLTYTLSGATTGSSPSTGINYADGLAYNVGITTVTYTVTNVNGLTATCSHTVWIKNLAAPRFSLTCPVNVSVNADAGQCNAAVTVPAPAINNPCNEAYTVTNDSPYKTSDTDASGTYPVGITTIHWTVTDASGNVTNCTQTVTVADTQAPALTCPPNAIDLITDGGCSRVPTTVQKPTFSDNCGIASLTYALSGATTGNSSATGINYADGLTYNVGVTTVTYTVTDVHGLTASCSHTVWIKNLAAPRFSVTCPVNVSVNADAGQCNAAVTVPAPAINNPCNEAYTVTNDSPYKTSDTDASGTYPVGITTIHWTVTDASGNVTNCTQTVTVADTQAPALTCPSNAIDLITDGGCSRVPTTVQKPTFSDNCGIASLTYTLSGATTGNSSATGINYADGLTYNVGVTTVTYTVTDVHGLTASCSHTVWIKNLAAPRFSVTCPVNVSVNADAGQCNAAVTVPAPAINNPCNESYTVTNDSPYKTSDTDASGTYPVGITTIHWTVTDASGNVTNCTQTVTVADTQAPALTCPPNAIDLITDGGCSRVPTTVQKPTFSDNCGIASLTYALSGATTGNSSATGINYADGLTYNVGVTTVTYTVTDVHGLTASCSHTVWIKNLAAPRFSVTCPVNVSVNADAGQCNAAVTVPAPAINNPCNEAYTVTNDSPYKTSDTDASGTYPVGITTIHWTVTDASGNVTNCTQTVTVADLLPVLACPGNITVPADYQQLYASNVTVPPPTYSDNCPNPTLTWEMTGVTTGTGTGDPSGINIVPSPNTFNVGVTTITYTFTDIHSHTVSCSFTVTVVSKPDIDCQPDINASTDAGGCTATLDPGFPVKVSGAEPITYTWIMTGATTGSGTGPIGNHTFNLGVTTITWRAENISGYAECTQLVTVTDHQPPTFVSQDMSECVNNVITAIYDNGSQNLNIDRPEYYIFSPGDTRLDLSGLSDNCCSPGSLTIHWSIVLEGTTTSLFSGTGQPSAISSEIHIAGDGVTFNEVRYTITYTVEDCHGNVSAPQYRTITIRPRPSLIKLN